MGKLTILKRLRLLIGEIGWKLFIWGMDTSEENYWLMIYEQEKFRQDKHQEDKCKCGNQLIGGYSCMRTDCNQNS